MAAVVLVGGNSLLVAGAAPREELDGVTGILILSAVVSAFVAVFVVAGMLGLHASRRRRTWGLLRSVGMTGRQMRGLVLAEALTLALVAGVVGSVLAVPYAGVAGAFVRGVGLAPGGIPLVVTPVPFVVAMAVGPVVTLMGSLGAARRAVRLRPVEVLREAHVQKRIMPWPRAGFGVVALAAGLWMAVEMSRMPYKDAEATVFGTTLILCTGVAALGPAVLYGLVRVAGAVLVRADPWAGRLARSGLLAAPGRAWSMVAPVMLTMALACTFLFGVSTGDAFKGVHRHGPSAWVAPLMVGSAVMFTVIGVVNASAVAMADRRDGLRLLRQLGALPAQLVRTVCWESLAATLVGVALGTAIAMISLLALGRSMTGGLWFEWSPGQYLGLLAVCVGGGLAGGLGATRSARKGALVPAGMTR
ncbi:FtsX-like permease family protein [Actinomadura rupiterrae]|uniref:FtsX-like permease family protein n=1 Tax=Actinomadura rupiterrae TaxID=559627 RepID=UPI0027E2199F|nr:FtsX-like permease family protein [Actinomadura rupiterrae]MCP2338660.1 putative ABC transport system permease protein [Actinomadura rupiterrae]